VQEFAKLTWTERLDTLRRVTVMIVESPWMNCP
jgi:hypothetical protein